MIVVIIDNSVSQIVGLTAEQHRKVKNLVSYTLNPTANYFSGGFRAQKKSLLDKKGFYPTGVNYLILRWLKSNSILYQMKELRIKPKSNPGMFKLNM